MQRVEGQDYFEAPEIAEMFGVTKQGVYWWIRNGKIRALRHPISRKYLISASEVERHRAALRAELRREHMETLSDTERKEG